MPDSEAILRAIEAQHGLLVKQAKQVYTFSHLTVQEFFTAKYIHATQGDGTVRQLISSSLMDAQWREVIIITASLIEEATELVEAAREEIRHEMAKINKRDQWYIRAIGGHEDPSDHRILSEHDKLQVRKAVARMQYGGPYESMHAYVQKVDQVKHLINALDTLAGCLAPHICVAKETRAEIRTSVWLAV